MKIGELNEHCENCHLLKYCAAPRDSPQLCAYEELADVEETEYRKIAESVTKEEIMDKLRQYEENNVMPWDDEVNGAICDIVLERLYRKNNQEGNKMKRKCEYAGMTVKVKEGVPYIGGKDCVIQDYASNILEDDEDIENHLIVIVENSKFIIKQDEMILETPDKNEGEGEGRDGIDDIIEKLKMKNPLIMERIEKNVEENAEKAEKAEMEIELIIMMETLVDEHLRIKVFDEALKLLKKEIKNRMLKEQK